MATEKAKEDPSVNSGQEKNVKTDRSQTVQFVKPDWTIDELYKKAWAIVKQNKILWIFGAAAGGYGYNNNLDFDNFDTERFQRLFNDSPENTQELSRVLGDATSASTDTITYLFSAVPTSLYIILGLEVLLLILLSIGISLIYQSWATGALLETVQMCIKDGKSTIAEASRKAYAHIKPLLWLTIVPGLILGLVTTVGSVILIAGLILGPTLVKVIMGIALFVFLLFIIYAYVMLALTTIWAERQIVVDHKPARKAFDAGLAIARKKKWAMLLLGFVNTILVGLIFGVPIIIIIFLVFGGILASNAVESILWILLIIAVPLLTLFVVGLTIAGGIMSAFKATVWSLAYDNIRGKYEK